ncbi:hypothetical protein D3C85_678130 [compost metagenome]
MHGPVELIERVLPRGQVSLHRSAVLAERRQSRFNLFIRKARMQRTQAMSIAPPLRHLPCVSGHTATQAHDLRVVGRFEIRVVPQDRLKYITIQWTGFNCLLKSRRFVDAKSQGGSLRVGQGVQHRGIKIVLAVQMLIAVVPRFVFAILIQDQHFADRRVDGAETVGQRSFE